MTLTLQIEPGIEPRPEPQGSAVAPGSCMLRLTPGQRHAVTLSAAAAGELSVRLRWLVPKAAASESAAADSTVSCVVQLGAGGHATLHIQPSEDMPPGTLVRGVAQLYRTTGEELQRMVLAGWIRAPENGTRPTVESPSAAKTPRGRHGLRGVVALAALLLLAAGGAYAWRNRTPTIRIRPQRIDYGTLPMGPQGRCVATGWVEIALSPAPSEPFRGTIRLRRTLRLGSQNLGEQNATLAWESPRQRFPVTLDIVSRSQETAELEGELTVEAEAGSRTTHEVVGISARIVP